MGVGRPRDNSDVGGTARVNNKGKWSDTAQHKEKKKSKAQKERNFASWGRKRCCVRAE